MKRNRLRVAVGVFGLAVAVMVATGCKTKVEPQLPPEAEGTTIVLLSDHWKLQQPGASISVKDTVLHRPLIITHTQDGRYHAFDAWCPHTGCPVSTSPAPGVEELECPCHGSSFDLEGTVQKGPAPVGLVEYALEEKGDSLVIDLSKRMVKKE